MIGRLTPVILLCTVSLIQPADVPRPINMTVVEVGGSVTMQCPVSIAEIKFFHWYKQSLGYMVQTVATGVYGNINCLGLFKNPRFKVDGQYFFSIRNVTKEDEAIYFCQGGTELSQDFLGGFFLAVNDNNQQTVYLKQSPKTASVQLGGSVTLQCSLLSQNKGNTDQCPGSHSVYWFRAGSGESHPGIIYSHKSRNGEQQKRSCAYNLSKTIRNSSDTGTYYCAVVTCGEMLFGEGTKVDTSMYLQ
ncbi:uncharacterized protein LOC123957308 [Micropterus dolomieu]|uniref:uncharacterized protein LOC123957308 n=1 Tax=Micropterus dolomieu TaxID=147949 RepID=UPI001E8D36A8|nr:uncharacterized protein LOC123957308 [Micropterus dolomieu]